jgi:hypothetical protein
MRKPSFLLIILLGLLLITTAVLAADGEVRRVTTLSGAEEVAGGDVDGSGFAIIRLNHGQGQVCWEVTFEEITAPSAAHIHSAPAGINGQIVVHLSPIGFGCSAVDQDLIKAITQHPELYYVNVHNTDFSAGALRGQLRNPGLSD